MRSFVARGLMPLVLACSFDATGVDTAPPAGAATMGGGGDNDSTGAGTGTGSSDPTTAEGSGGATSGGPEATSEPLTTGPMATTDISTTDATATTDISTTDISTTGPPETTTGPPETTGQPQCDELYLKTILLVENATVVAPMEKLMSGKGENTIARSEVAEQGSVTFTIELPCDGPVAVWGRVQDTNPGLVNSDPDSYYVSVDGVDDTDAGWYYGCQTEGKASGYHWLRVTTSAEPACGGPEWTPDLGAGTHSFRLRNREPVAFDDDIAAVARLLITNDMGYVPQMPD